MRCIGIIGAMEVEVASLKERMKDAQVVHKASMEFYAGMLENKNVVVVRSGIGKVNAAVCTQILIDDFKAEAVINTGIAHKIAGYGQVGAGTVHPPMECFEKAIAAYAKKLGFEA